MDARLSKALGCLAFALSLVTAISVAMTIFSLIDDPMLSVIFAAAAVLLDIFKYIGWPLALRMLQEGRRLFATTICVCVVTLGLVSGWSTYDRLMNSIEASKAKHVAQTDGRLAQLNYLIKKDSDFLESLRMAEERLDLGANDLRAKGMATKAQDLESATFERIDKQRIAAMQRMDSSSVEITDIRSSVAKAASIPVILAVMLCAGFALSLEIVPALLLSTLSTRGIEKNHLIQDFTDKAPDRGNKNTKNSDTIKEVHSPLLIALIKKAESFPSYSKIRVKEFASENRIGNLKACALFKEAEIIGVIKRTNNGYLTTPSRYNLNLA
ncbi:hypothetical protein NP572_19485 [Pseudomonas putida]|uniref:hypothetical protein n=1 Tax=Pseudomonas putida TaxID=303 RepID=UPI00236365C7|nr:hypothetical protein [Pseudomonas putida]MDD2038754.1 hypothetical protein [Pseudomonas putida]MDD2044301.1 hypothetical protein [Pseudomonas putida]